MSAKNNRLLRRYRNAQHPGRPLADLQTLWRKLPAPERAKARKWLKEKINDPAIRQTSAD